MDLSSVAAQAVVSSTRGDAAQAKPELEASPEAVAAFHDMIAGSGSGAADVAASPSDEVSRVRAPAEITIEAPAGIDGEGVAGPMTPGDAILRGMQKMSDGFTGAMDQIGRVAESTKPGDMINAGDMLKAQLALSQVTLHQDMTSKVVGKATQSLDMFLKNQ